MRSALREPTPQERARYVANADPERLEELIAEQILEAVRDVLARLGTPQICVICGRAIWWVQTLNGRRRVPYSARGVPHSEDCAMAGRPEKVARRQT